MGGRQAAEKQLFMWRKKMANVLDNLLFKDAIVFLRGNIKMNIKNTLLGFQGEQLWKQI